MAKISNEKKVFLDSVKQNSNITSPVFIKQEYLKTFYSMLLYYQDTFDSNIFSFTKSDLIKLFGVVNDDFYSYSSTPNKLVNDINSKNNDIKDFEPVSKSDVNKFYRKIYRSLMNDFNNFIFALEDEDILAVNIFWEAKIISNPKFDVFDSVNEFGDVLPDYLSSQSNSKKTKILSNKDLQVCLDIKYEAMKYVLNKTDNDVFSFSDVVKAKKVHEFDNYVRKELANKLNIYPPYRIYHIVFNPNVIANELQDLNDDSSYIEKVFLNNRRFISRSTKTKKSYSKAISTKIINNNPSVSKKTLENNEKRDLKVFKQLTYALLLLQFPPENLKEYLNHLLYKRLNFLDNDKLNAIQKEFNRDYKELMQKVDDFNDSLFRDDFE